MESAEPDKPGLSYNKFSAIFRADLLHALEPIIRSSQCDWRGFSREGLFIEPCSEGGVLLIATDGVSLAAVRDPDGKATGNGHVTIPDVIFAAATPPKPVSAWSEGDTLALPLPEWAQPGKVYLWGLAAWVLPQMPLPDEDETHLLAHAPIEDGNVYAGGYRIHTDCLTLPWRRIFSGAAAACERTQVWLDPAKLGMFSRAFDLFRQTKDDGSVRGGLNLSLSADKAIILRLLNVVDFVGAIMPMDGDDLPAEPSWAAAALPRKEGE